MKSVRRPVIALSTTLVLVVIQAVADPTGLLALVGWSGALPQVDALWTWAPFVVYLPVLFGVLWWVTVRAGDRFWTLAAGVVLAVLLAHAAACLVMTWDLATAAWAAGYVTAKAVPAALIVAAFTRWFGGRSERQKHEVKAVRLPALIFAAVAPLLAGLWWTGAVYAPGVPAAAPRSRRALGDRGDGAPRRRHRALPALDARACARRARRMAGRARRRRRRRDRPGHRRARVDGVQGDIWPLMADLRRRRGRTLVRRVRRLDRGRERGPRRPHPLGPPGADAAARRGCDRRGRRGRHAHHASERRHGRGIR